MNIHQYIQALLAIESRLSENFIKIAEYHKTEPGIYYGCQEMASISDDHAGNIRRAAELQNRNAEAMEYEPIISMIKDHNTGLDLGADLRYMWLLAMEALMLNNLLLQASADQSEHDLELLCCNFERDTQKQTEWLMYRIMMTARKTTVNI